MTLVNVKVADREIELECTPAEVKNLQNLAAQLSSRLKHTENLSGHSNANTLLTITAITMLDEMNEMQSRMSKNANDTNHQEQIIMKDLTESVRSLSSVCDDIENLAKKVGES